MAESPFIVDVTADGFEEIIESSSRVPVLLDFWASWCQPCLMLAPILAGLAEEYRGRFVLARLNTEEEPEIAAQFGIRSIPTVKLIRDGQAVDEFMGALPEKAVREFLDRHLPRDSDDRVLEAREFLQAGNADAALAVLDAARAADPDNPRIPLALAEAQAAAGDLAAAEATLEDLPLREQDKPEVGRLRSRLYFEDRAAGAPAADVLEARLDGDPDDHDALYQLALRRAIAGDYGSAADLLLQLMEKDRGFGDDAARLGLLSLFDLLGEDARVGGYRSRMARLMY